MADHHAPVPILAFLFSASLVSGGCDSAPEKPADKPVAAAADTVPPNGEELFISRCSSCHGAKGEGRVGIGPRLASASFLAAASDDMLRKTIKEGRAGTTMIPWGASLKEAELEALIKYIRGLAPHEPVELNEAPLKGNAESGQQIFATICEACHGRNGGGYVESSSGTGIGRKVFLDSVTDGFLRYIIKNGKSLTQMKSFSANAPAAVANLDDQQVEDVITYLRGNAW